jgi:HlyD family secretion protein
VRDAFTDHPYVLRVDHGRASAAPVSLGVRGGGTVEIVGGVREGDLVVPATAKVAAGERIRANRRA